MTEEPQATPTGLPLPPASTRRSQTNRNLGAAFLEEAKAHTVYQAYAFKAMEEGRPEVAEVFFEVGGAETAHALAHLRVLGEVGSSYDNLKRVIEEETREAGGSGGASGRLARPLPLGPCFYGGIVHRRGPCSPSTLPVVGRAALDRGFDRPDGDRAGWGGSRQSTDSPPADAALGAVGSGDRRRLRRAGLPAGRLAAAPAGPRLAAGERRSDG